MSSGKQTALKPVLTTARSMGWVLLSRVRLSSAPSKGHTSLWRGTSVADMGVYSEEPLLLALRHAGVWMPLEGAQRQEYATMKAWATPWITE